MQLLFFIQTVLYVYVNDVVRGVTTLLWNVDLHMIYRDVIVRSYGLITFTFAWFKKSWFELKCFAITKIKWCYEILWCYENGRRQEDYFLISNFYFSDYRRLNRGIMSSQALRQVSHEILLIFLKN